MDRWHLRESGLENMFGRKAFRLLKNHLHQLVGPKTDQKNDNVVSLAFELIRAQVYRDDEAEQNLGEFVLAKKHYSNHCIHKLEGNLGRKGSVVSKHNHSSLLFSLNMKESKTNMYCESPMVECRNLMKRQ
jgi:hypothetical protein